MKKIIGIVLIVILVLAFGCTVIDSNISDSNTGGDSVVDNNITAGGQYNNLDQFKKVKNGDFIAVNYTGKLENGEVFDSSLTPGREPLTFTVGAGQMIKGFDAGVVGMKVGDKKTITISPEEGYGLLNEDNKQIIPKENLPQQDFKVGEVYIIGQYRLKIYEINDSNIVASVNNFLAGQTLIFEVELVSIK